MPADESGKWRDEEKIENRRAESGEGWLGERRENREESRP